ncbi:hypothetical protein FBEOM_13765 [Fusarium beomiforme]|uniref:ER transporter 6TM N-terminal domain-containing protein n=1 Tax=Fusarium beomiforme TaxID=44412 RepID=A0A9P5A532_9HYPO|nr:hypothetical protein FBEOM_13765 [Fusarium beomiforme]
MVVYTQHEHVIPNGDGLREEESQSTSSKGTPNILENPFFADKSQNLGPGRKLPVWLDHFKAKDLKRLFRCSIAMWIMTIFIYINPIQKEMGNASFLGCIVLWLAPPSGTIFMRLIVGVTVMLGVTTAWAWGLVTMKAALATRSDANTLARLTELQEMAISQNSTDPKTYAEIKIFNGFMLNTSVTATYFCMIGLYLYLIARLRVAAPKLRLTQMMGCIVSTVFLTQAPLLPNFNGNVARPLVLPCAIAEASEALDLLKDLLAPMPTFLDACLLGLEHPTFSMSTEKITAAKMNLLKTYTQFVPVTTFLPIDFSIGRWSSEDLTMLCEPVRQLVFEFTGLLDIHGQAEVHEDRPRQLFASVSAVDNGTQGGPRASQTGPHQKIQEASVHPSSNCVGGVEEEKQSLQVLSDPAKSLVEACKATFEAIREALLNSNAFKESPGHEEMLRNHISVLEKLSTQRKVFNAATSGWSTRLIDHIFDDDGVTQVQPSTIPGFTGLIKRQLINERLSQLAGALECLFSKVVELEKSRIALRLWLPTKLASLFVWMARKEQPEDMPGTDIGGTAATRIPTIASVQSSSPAKSHASQGAKSSRAQLNSMRRPSSRRRRKAGQVFLTIANWLGNAEGVFAIRMVIMSVVLSLPAVIHSSAGFYYREYGLWAVIMAQLTLLPHTAEVVYGIVVRVVGTIVGGFVGMAAWYIGSGSGPGSPYGEAAIMAVVIVIFMWWRLFASTALVPAGIMMGITAYIVAIYSWIDTHEDPYGNPGKGFEVFWRRLVLVLVGLGATFITNSLPKPPSSNRHYRHLLSDSLSNIRDQYALFASNWKEPATDLRDVAEEEVLAAMEALFSVSGSIKLTVFEFSSSNFDTDTLSQIVQLCMLMHQAVAQLLVYATRLSEAQRAWVIPATGVTQQDMIPEIMAVLTMVQQTLKTDDPLPAVLHTPFLPRAIALSREQLTKLMHDNSIHNKYGVDSEGLRRYVMILNAFLQMLAALDELVLAMKKVVGESSSISTLDV